MDKSLLQNALVQHYMLIKNFRIEIFGMSK